MADGTVFCDELENLELYPCTIDGGFGVILRSLIAGFVALAFVVLARQKILQFPRGTDVMNAISDKIKSGAKSFLRTEYKYLAVFVLCTTLFLLIYYTIHPPTNDRSDGIVYASSFLVGAVFSAYAGWWGMTVATDANVRTTQAAATQGLAQSLQVAFLGGSVMGFTVVGLGLLGVSLMLYVGTVSYSEMPVSMKLVYASESLAGFGFGASSIALFARVAGGIYTKAADIGADLVGKVEMDIPEDDPRNPAVIADNVGDNVGDVAGMGADLFESFVGSMVAAIALANGDVALVMLPLWVSGTGILASMVGCQLVRTKEGATQKQLLASLFRGTVAACGVQLILTAYVCWRLFEGRASVGWDLFLCVAIGLAAGVAIGQVTEYFTSYSYWPVQSITDAGVTGPATVIIQGLGIGMISAVWPVLILVATILGCDALADEYGIAMAAVGMLSTLGLTLATDAYGPIADNAGGIAEMANLDESVRQTTDALDALGNTTAATGKGFAIGSAVLTALSLLSAFTTKAEIEQADIGEPIVLAGALIGAMMPFLFAALTMLSVQKAAGKIIVEVRRQFAEIPGLREGTAEAQSDRCVEIATKSAVEEMILPGLYAVMAPITVGFLVGPKCLTGLLGGAIASGMMLAIMMANAGGAWDNAKKYIEIEGAKGGKGTDIHKACVVGDTVGDPFKDTSGPALNILIKLMSIMSLTIAPMLQGKEDWEKFYFGLIPLGMTIGGTYLVYMRFWRGGTSISVEHRGPEVAPTGGQVI